MKARLILMDEPTSSLTEDGAERLFGVISDLKQSGVAIVYVSHKMDEIFRICDRVTVLRDGEIIGTEEIVNTAREALIRMMVGRNLEQWTRTARPAASEVLLSVSNLTTAKLHDVSFELKKGEVLGIAGLVGAGRSELGAALFGLHKRHCRRSPAARRSDPSTLSGCSHRPRHWPCTGGSQAARADDADERARKQHRCEAEKFSEVRFSVKKRELSALRPLYQQLALKSASWSAPVSTLSGGNQQKALLARWLLIDPEVLFLDDPARGIDVGAKQDIYQIIDRLAGEGKGVILVSSELPELLHCSDRILVLNEGRVTALYEGAEVIQEKIMTAATSVGGSEMPA